MKRLLISLLILVLGWMIMPNPVALAADLAHGKQVFSSNCVACHLGGGNVVDGSKTLSKADLEKNQMASVEAIQRQVTNGKSAMPMFKGRLTDADIEDVANYVLDQAGKGW